MALWIQLKFGIADALFQGYLHRKNIFFVQVVLSYRYMKILVKYTLACLATQVSLAAWLTNIHSSLLDLQRCSNI